MMENWLTSGVSTAQLGTPTVLAREERLALEHLGKDTPSAPDIDCGQRAPTRHPPATSYFCHVNMISGAR